MRLSQHITARALFRLPYRSALTTQGTFLPPSKSGNEMAVCNRPETDNRHGEMMSEYSTNENYAKAIRHKITSTAKSMLEGELSFLSGARILASLRHEFPSGADDRDFLVFVAVDSETDHFPLGEPCQHWDKQSLGPVHIFTNGPNAQASEANTR